MAQESGRDFVLVVLVADFVGLFVAAVEARGACDQWRNCKCLPPNWPIDQSKVAHAGLPSK